MRLNELPQPYIVAVATDRDLESTAATIALAAEQGAHAVELNLPALHHISNDVLRDLIVDAPIPVYTSCRRASFMRVYGMDPDTLPYWTDAERMERQLAVLAAGSCAIDMELDTFDPRPAPTLGTADAARFARDTGPASELSDDLQAVKKQREIVERAHQAGASVILSCHTGRPQTGTQLAEIAGRAVERGGDLIKIVMPCRNRDDLRTLLRATSWLAASLPIPFVLIGAGPEGMPSRLLGPRFGSAWYITQAERKPGGFPDQPLISEVLTATPLVPRQMEV
jgi:hypothetical protein